MRILWEKLPSGRWVINNGTFTRNKTSLRKVTNRFLKKKLVFNGTSLKAY